jgi:uncharacterized protein with FMN-binding domain
MKKYILPIIAVVIIAGYIIWSNQGTNTTTVVNPGKNGTPSTTALGTGEAATTTTTSAQTSKPSAPTTGQYVDGTYTGIVADAYFGNLQVAAVIKNGKLVDVNFLQYPNDQGESIRINNRSNAILKQEAITSQNANVKIVTGATQSSEAFQQSLASALAEAK